MLYLIDHGLEEFGESTGEKGEPQLVARCLFEDFGTLQKALEERGIVPVSAEHEYLCTTPTELREAEATEVLELIDKLEQDEDVHIPKGLRVRRLHKAFLRYHDPHNWPLLREALRRMGRADLIGNGRQHLVPSYQPVGTGRAHEGKRKAASSGKPFRTQHTGLPRTPRRGR